MVQQALQADRPNETTKGPWHQTMVLFAQFTKPSDDCVASDIPWRPRQGLLLTGTQSTGVEMPAEAAALTEGLAAGFQIK